MEREIEDSLVKIAQLPRHAVGNAKDTMESEEALREAACIGNLKAMKKLISSGANINSQNSMNGWTALHWACKRGHASIVQILLQNGADVNIKNFKGELPSELTTSVEVLATMKIEPGDNFTQRCSEGAGKLPIIPNYLRNPVFPYSVPDDDHDSVLSSTTTSSTSHSDRHSTNKHKPLSEEGPPIKSFVTSTTSDSGKNLASEVGATATTSPLVLRVRVFGIKDSDFVEVELPSLTYSSLLESCCEELEVALRDVAKIRKLPNVWVRKDKDVQRLKEGQELEIILHTD